MKIADALANELDAREVRVAILGKVGSHITECPFIHIQLDPSSCDSSRVVDITRYWLENHEAIEAEILEGKRTTF